MPSVMRESSEKHIALRKFVLYVPLKKDGRAFANVLLLQETVIKNEKE